MKILLATYWAVPHVGGVWPFMQQLQKQLQARGHEVDLLGNGGDPGDPNVSIIGKAKFHKSKVRPLLAEKLSKETYPFIHRNQLVLYTELERYMFELAAAYLNVERYDVIHAQDVIASGCIQRVRSGGAALVASLHGSVAREVERQFGTIHKSSTTPVAKAYFHALEHFGASSPEATIVANNWLKNMLIQDFNVPAQKLRLYPYGYDQAAFTHRMKQASDVRKPAGKKVIMFAGRLIELKAPHHLTGALAGLEEAAERLGMLDCRRRGYAGETARPDQSVGPGGRRRILGKTPGRTANAAAGRYFRAAEPARQPAFIGHRGAACRVAGDRERFRRLAGDGVPRADGADISGRRHRLSRQSFKNAAGKR